MNVVDFYYKAKQETIALGYASEIEWQKQQHPTQITETLFLQETAWVIYCSGFREATIRRYFDLISLCFCDWESAKEIVKHRERCITSATYVFRHKRKHSAISEIATIISNLGFCQYKTQLLCHPIKTLQKLPFIGHVTSYHLAKNLGFDVVKPDRHLVRLNNFFKYASVYDLCYHLSKATGDSMRVVDVVLWRYLEQKGSSGKILNEITSSTS